MNFWVILKEENRGKGRGKWTLFNIKGEELRFRSYSSINQQLASSMDIDGIIKETGDDANLFPDAVECPATNSATWTRQILSSVAGFAVMMCFYFIVSVIQQACSNCGVRFPRTPCSTGAWSFSGGLPRRFRRSTRRRPTDSDASFRSGTSNSNIVSLCFLSILYLRVFT